MILTERTINIIDHESIMDSPVVLYRGDKNVELKLNIKSSRFKFRDDDSSNFIESAQASYGQLIIQTPNQNEPIFSEITATKKGYIIFVITAEMIDEIDEVGAYTFQVRLLDSNKRSRATIPPVVNGIEIREPITSEDSNVLNSAVVGLASAANEEVLDTFDFNGNYAKSNWKFGDKITAAKLNKAEDGIYQSYALGLNNSSQIKEVATEKMDKNSLIGMSNLSQEVKESMTGGSVAVVGKGAVLDENISESSFVKAVTNNFLEQGLFSDDGSVLYDNTYTEVSNDYTNRLTGNGMAFGFTYNYDYDKLIISGLKADNDGTLIIGITTKDRLTGWVTEIESKCIYIKKIPITANEQLNIEVDISEINSLLTKGQYYMMSFCSVLDVESPTYNSNNAIYFKRIKEKGFLVNETPIEDIKYILNYGSYAWNPIASSLNPCDYIPSISLRRLPTSYKCYIENYVESKVKEAMTGGNVAVVGKGAVLDENISESSYVKAVTNNFLEQGLFSDGSEFLCDNTYTEVNDNYTNRLIGNGMAFGFTYNHNYGKLIIKGIKADNDGTLTIGVLTKENLTGWVTQTDEKCIYTKKVPITANEQLDLEVDISDMNTLLTKGQYYMMAFYSILDVEAPTYNSNNAIYLKCINSKGELVKETPIEDIKYILNYGSFSWSSIATGLNPHDYIPAISLKRQMNNRYKCDIDNYVKRKILEATNPLIDKITQLQSNKQVSNFVPKDIPLVKNDTIQIFYDSIFNVKNIGNYNLKVENALNDFFERKATITATSDTKDTVTKLSLVDDFNNEVSSVDLNFKVYPIKNPTTQKNLLIIGDSLTEFGDSGGCETASTLYEKLQEKGITNVNFIGTKSGRNANAKNEGRAGWRSWDYTSVNREDNPFVYNGVIDFNAYCTANNFRGIDYCIIHMNWNAFGWPKETMWNTLKELADKVLESYPNCKMFIVGMSAYSKYKYSGTWYCTKETVWEIDRYYQEQCDKLDNFRYVSLLPYRDMDYANNYREVDVNLRNSKQKERELTDHVHCGNVGYQQIADVYFRELVRQINLDS